MKSQENEAPPTRKAPSLKRNVAWYTGGNLVYSIGQFALVLVLARVASPEVVGMFGAARALTMPPMAFASLNLRRLLAATRQSDYRFDDFLGLRTVCLLFAMVFISVVAFAQYPTDQALVVLFVALTAVADQVSDVIYGVLQQNEMMGKIAISRALLGVSNIIALTTGFVATKSLLVATMCLFGVSASVVLLYDVPNLRRLMHRQRQSGTDALTEIVMKPRFVPSRLWGLFKIALPLALTWAFIQLMVNIPRYFVEQRQGLQALGFYTAMASLVTAATILQSALGHSITPRLTKYYYTDLPKFRGLARKHLKISWASFALNIFIGFVAGQWLLHLLYGENYSGPEFFWPFAILMTGNAIHLIMAAWRDIVTAGQVLKPQPFIKFVGVLTITGVCAWLVGSDVPYVGGLAGASTGFLAGMAVLYVSYAWLGSRVMKGVYSSTEAKVQE